eukprot:m.109515 g.109515  ORF g.109515 m.109515 type:complete len:53 (+) comp10689_c0_seq15:2547-2705(+)
MKAEAMGMDVTDLESASEKFVVGGTKYPYDTLVARDVPDEVRPRPRPCNTHI